MAELTKEQLIEEAKLKIAIAKCHPNSGVARVEGELFKIALASLEAELVGELTMLVKQLAWQLRKAKPECKLPDKAMDYLKRNGLISAEDILR